MNHPFLPLVPIETSPAMRLAAPQTELGVGRMPARALPVR